MISCKMSYHADINKEVANALPFLVDYTKRHVAPEEKLMDNKKRKAIAPLALIDFPINWFINHVRCEDQKIGKSIAA
jgi:hemerythrin